MGTEEVKRIDSAKATEIRLEEQRKGHLPLVELHILRSFGPECLNRGFDNKHKKIVVGGYERDRFSSQCMLHAIAEKQLTHDRNRSRFFKEDVAAAVLEKLGIAVSDDETAKARAIVSDVVDEIKDGKANDNGKAEKETDPVKKGDLLRTANTITYDNFEVQVLADCVLEHLQDNADSKKLIKVIKSVFAEKVQEFTPSMEMALRGRMSTISCMGSYPSAIHAAHAYSVNEAAGDYDDFTSDDTGAKKYKISYDTEQMGASYMQTQDVSSSTYYWYVAVDTSQIFETYLLHRELPLSQELINRYVKDCEEMAVEFAWLAMTTVPSAKQTTMASTPDPDAAVMVVKRGSNNMLTFDSSFVKPVRSTANECVAEIAVRRLLKAAELASAGAFSRIPASCRDKYGRHAASDTYVISDFDDVYCKPLLLPDGFKKITTGQLEDVIVS